MRLIELHSMHPGFPFIDPQDIPKIKFLYHGSTATPNIILHQGLKTRETQSLSKLSRDSTWQNSIYLALRPKAVEWYGPYVYSIDFAKLDKNLLSEDEDACGHSYEDCAYTWEGSLQIMGTCRYRGNIPPSLITYYGPGSDKNMRTKMKGGQ